MGASQQALLGQSAAAGGGSDVAIGNNNGSVFADLYASVFTKTSYTCNGNVLVVDVATSYGSAHPTGVTFNGSAMTSLAGINNNGYHYLSRWVLVSPAQTTASIVVTYAAIGKHLQVYATSMQNCDVAGTPYGTTVTDIGAVGDTVVSQTAAGETGGLILDSCMADRGSITTITHGTGQTPLYNNAHGSASNTYSIMGVSHKAGGASVAIDWTANVAGYMNLIATPFNKV